MVIYQTDLAKSDADISVTNSKTFREEGAEELGEVLSDWSEAVI